MSRNAQQELEEMEARGRRMVQQQQNSQDRAREEAKKGERLERSRQVKRFIGGYQTRAVPLAILFVGWAMGAYFVHRLGATIGLSLFLGMIPGGLGVSFPTWIFGSVAAERRWLTGLPFQLDNYFEMLTTWHDSPVGFEIAFANDEPSADSLHALFAVTDPGVEITRGKGTLLAKFPTPTVGGGDNGIDYGGTDSAKPYGPGVVALVHKVAKTLTLLHAQYAIDWVKVRSGKKL